MPHQEIPTPQLIQFITDRLGKAALDGPLFIAAGLMTADQVDAESRHLYEILQVLTRVHRLEATIGASAPELRAQTVEGVH